MKKCLPFITAGILFFAPGVHAQDAQKKQTEDIVNKSGGLYLEFRLIHDEGSAGKAAFVANSAGVEMMNYFDRNRLGISGYAVAYKKYLNHDGATGHFLGGKAFREFKTGPVGLKLATGFEWGNPSGKFDKTGYSYGPEGKLLSYRHVFEKRNSGIPGVKPSHDAVWRPVADFSVVKRRKAVIIEAGIRANIMRFGVDDYDLAGNGFAFSSRDRLTVVPSVFIGLGFKI
ncbi:MAG: hypothetical protein A2742_01860 [Candidatus Yanofskybacteria bacterium RIFCSPHIGHO2_01_FULL_43_32]|nr:MAG: hypothetical protein A2742_01860 [Candidatus Yanofskybacteria bacterium RIFCSPHIGHO2_01_FULL_43_32]OGN11855.1 MAG: hypothetical protein A3C69_01535 [Candidatus Yanofskybacteria bacterium RIFCSPHIGHO2_02_FULL_43_12]OGN18066.1 MAG: hypothetical protein A3E34_02215 [Candidatus Yanofskybacteria bacterium RIFCSPHIGHO2_12_FULL_43_11]OGN25349.1 MAG: hypothetical protein A2923_01650 [Candidatus Yanofskybacteria bacterium RIFCSPLOWO2_01_FULL_43_46]